MQWLSTLCLLAYHLNNIFVSHSDLTFPVAVLAPIINFSSFKSVCNTKSNHFPCREKAFFHLFYLKHKNTDLPILRGKQLLDAM